MNTSEYIASGIVENYVLGLLGDQETQEVECMSKIYPEIKTYLIETEEALAKYAQANAITPPKALKGKIMAAIDALPERTTTQKEAKVIEMPTSMKVASRNYQWAAAASFLFAIAVSFLYYNSQKSNEATLAALEQKQVELENATAKSNAQLADLQIIKNSTRVQLKGINEKAPNGLVTVFWDNSTQNVLIEVNDLPNTPTDKQYQLWALADGKPIDLGVFDVKDGVQKMKNVPNAQAFAITLEPKGGSVSPTLAEMFVMGKVG